MDPWAIVRASITGVAALLLLAPGVLADTCCANTAVGLEPTSASPGATVELSGLRCLNADGTGPLPLRLDAFWLSAGERAAEPAPDVVPGPGLPADLPPADEWPHFGSVSPAGDGTGRATITVPPLAAGTYQLWWTCDEDGGPGSGIHYSTGPRLTVEAVPDTATATRVPTSTGARWAPLLVLAFAVSLVAMVLRVPHRRLHDQ